MSFGEGLVDLSLFDWAPADGGYSNLPDILGTRSNHQSSSSEPVREYYAPTSVDETPYHPVVAGGRDEVMKPLPPLPRTRICQQAASRCDDGSQCILKRMKRTGTTESTTSPSALLQRRNVPQTPQLTLSMPESNHQPRVQESAMVWMPDEQMWLVVGEEQPVIGQAPRTDHAAPASYPTPPLYSSGTLTRSEPASRVTSRWNMTPPATPIQYQLQSLLQPRDEERLSPLFQEAMNSVPLIDPHDLPPPPSYEGTFGRTQSLSTPRTSIGDSIISSSSLAGSSSHVQRAQTASSRRPRLQQESLSAYSVPGWESLGSYHSRSHTDEGPSYQAYNTLGLQSSNGSGRSWHGLAKKIARPRSAT